MRNHTRARQALTIISTLTALVTGTYIAFGDGFTWDPYAYTAAWLLLISSLAYTIPQTDTVLTLAKRRHTPAARVVRSTTHMEAGR